MVTLFTVWVHMAGMKMITPHLPGTLLPGQLPCRKQPLPDKFLGGILVFQGIHQPPSIALGQILRVIDPLKTPSGGVPSDPFILCRREWSPYRMNMPPCYAYQND